MHKVVLLRHGESLWNRENRFTGWTDVGLTEQGVEEAREAARVLSASEALRVEIGFKRPWFGELDEATLTPIRAELGQATFDEEWALGRKLTVDQAIALALESAV